MRKNGSKRRFISGTDIFEAYVLHRFGQGGHIHIGEAHVLLRRGGQEGGSDLQEMEERDRRGAREERDGAEALERQDEMPQQPDQDHHKGRLRVPEFREVQEEGFADPLGGSRAMKKGRVSTRPMNPSKIL